EASLRVRLRDSLTPACRRQLEHASLRPGRNEAEQVAQVAPRLDAVQLAAGQERDKRGIDLAGVVVAPEVVEALCANQERAKSLEQALAVASRPTLAVRFDVLDGQTVIATGEVVSR